MKCDKARLLSVALLFVGLSLHAKDGCIVLAPTAEILHAEFRTATFSQARPRAVLILCPGQNGDGKALFYDESWRAFAAENGLALMVPSFASSDEDLQLGRGYFVASRGSGPLLQEALRLGGWEQLPLLLYGFSGGAHFTMSFSAWAPQRVLGFCSYSFAWWSSPPAGLRCPALIVCGQFDGCRYGATFSYFQSGRRQGKPWAWVSVAEKDHSRSADLEDFVRGYFRSLLTSHDAVPVTVDNVTESPVGATKSNALATSVLPSAALLAPWQTIHHP